MMGEPFLSTAVPFTYCGFRQLSFEGQVEAMRISNLFRVPVYFHKNRGEFRPFEGLGWICRRADSKTVAVREILHRVGIAVLSGTHKPSESFVPIFFDTPPVPIEPA